MNNKFLLIIFAVLMLGAGAANADCTCRCVDGEMQPLCESARDVPPICHRVTCPMVRPSIAPVVTPTAPPHGTANCRQARVCDQFGNCEWQQVCRGLHHGGFVEDP